MLKGSTLRIQLCTNLGGLPSVTIRNANKEYLQLTNFFVSESNNTGLITVNRLDLTQTATNNFVQIHIHYNQNYDTLNLANESEIDLGDGALQINTTVPSGGGGYLHNFLGGASNIAITSAVTSTVNTQMQFWNGRSGSDPFVVAGDISGSYIYPNIPNWKLPRW